MAKRILIVDDEPVIYVCSKPIYGQRVMKL